MFAVTDTQFPEAVDQDVCQPADGLKWSQHVKDVSGWLHKG